MNNLQKRNLRENSNEPAFTGSINMSKNKAVRNFLLTSVALLAMACTKQTTPSQQPQVNPQEYVDPYYITDPNALTEFYEWYDENCPECLKIGYVGNMPENVREIAIAWGQAVHEWWYTYNATHNNDGNGNP